MYKRQFPSYLNLREKYLKGEYILAYYGDDREIKVQISKNIEKVDLQEVYSLRLFLSSFYLGIALCYRYALDAIVGGDFLQCNEDDVINAIKKWILTYNLPSQSDISFARIFARLNTLETSTASLKDCYNTLREHYNYVPINSKPSKWLPTVKIEINTETFQAQCDIMSEFCLMPKDIYESLNLWGLTEGGKEISLANNDTLLPIGIAKGVFTKILGKMISTDYLVIEYAGKGQITLGRSLLELLGAIIDVGKGTMHLDRKSVV